MDQTIKNVSDETVEIVKDFGRTAKKQVVGNRPQGQMRDTSSGIQDEDKDNKTNKANKASNTSPVTGKPIPSKKVLTQLNQQVAQLAQLRMKKVREELEKQRLKLREAGPSSAEAPEGQGKPKEDVIAKVLKASKSTGEFGKNIGG